MRLKTKTGRRAGACIAAVIVLGAAAFTGVQALNGKVDGPAHATQQARRLTPPAPIAPAQPAGTFPTSATAGVPVGWAPTTSITGNYTVSTAGAVVEDLRITNGSLIVNAANVTLRRVEVIGGGIDNGAGSSCRNGLVIENSTVVRGTQQTTSADEPAIGTGGYTARSVKIDGVSEGFRVGGRASMGCGAVVIENSWVRVTSPDVCGDWHGDGLQGYDGAAVSVSNTYIELNERNGCGGTAPFFYPAGQGNTSVAINGLIVNGGGAAFRLGTPGAVQNLKIVDGSWFYTPTVVECPALTAWSAQIVTLDPGGQPVRVRDLAC